MSVLATDRFYAAATIPSMTSVIAKPRRAMPESHPSMCHWSRTCEHELVVRLKKYQGGLLAKRQCRKCGRGQGNIVPRAGVTELWDDKLEEQVAADYSAAVREWESQYRAEEWQRPDFWEAHAKYMKSAVWKTKRELVFRRADGICECCGQRRAEQVHHLSYPEVFGLEPLWTLRAVCRKCHEIIHPHMLAGGGSGVH